MGGGFGSLGGKLLFSLAISSAFVGPLVPALQPASALIANADANIQNVSFLMALPLSRGGQPRLGIVLLLRRPVRIVSRIGRVVYRPSLARR